MPDAFVTVVNLRTCDSDVYCGRDHLGRVPSTPGERGWLGNPFDTKSRERNIIAFRSYFQSRLNRDPAFVKALDELAIQALTSPPLRLGCFCAPLPCHADVIAAHLLLRIPSLLPSPPM